MGWETVVLDGGPADGLRIRVSGRAPVLQVVQPCPVEPDQPDQPDQPDHEDRADREHREDPEDQGNGRPGTRVQALYVYRRTPGRPPRYRFDPASP